MSESPKLPAEAGEQNKGAAANAVGAHNVGRRRLLQAGISAAPVVMTVLSGPVLGQTGQSPSAFNSANTSTHHPNNSATSNGLSHGYWKNNDPWPSPYARTDLFNSVFTGGGYPGLTLDDVLHLKGGGNNPLARDIVGALLNAASGANPPSIMTPALIKDMWNQFITTGHWVSGTIDWDGSQIETWLQSTFT